MVNGSFYSNTHHFRDFAVFLEAGNDVIAISPLGGAVYTDVDLWLLVVFALTAALSAVAILALQDEDLTKALKDYRAQQTQAVLDSQISK